MSLRILSVVPQLVSLFFFSAFVVAWVNVTANCTLSSLNWTFNSLGQSPCMVAASMLATCCSGSYTLVPLPSGSAYVGPPDPEYSNKCECSTVGYSLISACIECQGQDPFSWSEYTVNCTSKLPPSQFPNPVPAGIRVPYWAILDVTNENNWNANESYDNANNPEYGPGAIFGGASDVYTPSASATTTATAASPTVSSTASSTAPHSEGHAGSIAGGVTGGIAIISISIAVTAILYRRRRRSQAESAGLGAFQPMLDDEAVAHGSPSTIPSTMRFYDPDDPTTFPGYQGPLASHWQVHLSSYTGSGSTLASMQTSPPSSPLPRARGTYTGLPMPQ